MYKRLSNGNVDDERSTATDKTETNGLSSAAISDSYGSTPVQDKSDQQCYVPWCGVVFYIMSFFGVFCTLLLRIGLSVAIVAMVNQTAVAEENVMTNVTEDQCPRQPVSEFQYESGEFNWDRHEQGIVLAAYSIGNLFTQVCFVNSSGVNTDVPTFVKIVLNFCRKRFRMKRVNLAC